MIGWLACSRWRISRLSTFFLERDARLWHEADRLFSGSRSAIPSIASKVLRIATPSDPLPERQAGCRSGPNIGGPRACDLRQRTAQSDKFEKSIPFRLSTTLSSG